MYFENCDFSPNFTPFQCLNHTTNQIRPFLKKKGMPFILHVNPANPPNSPTLNHKRKLLEEKKRPVGWKFLWPWIWSWLSCWRTHRDSYVCEVVVAKNQYQHLEILNMARFFPTLKNFTKVANLAAFGGFFKPFVLNTKIFVWPSQIILVFS